MNERTDSAPKRRRNPNSSRWFATEAGRAALRGNRFSTRYPDERIIDIWRVGSDLTLSHPAVAKITGMPLVMVRRVRMLARRAHVIRATFGEDVKPQHPYSAWSPDPAYRVPGYRKAEGMELDASERRLRLKRMVIVATPERVVVDAPSNPQPPSSPPPPPGSVVGTDGRTYTSEEVERIRARVNRDRFKMMFPYQ